MSNEKGFAVVFVGEMREADQVRSLLEANGLTPHMWDEAIGTWAPWIMGTGDRAGVRVVVPGDQEEVARELLEGMDEGGGRD